MNEIVDWMAACAEESGSGARQASREGRRSESAPIEDLPVHGFPGRKPVKSVTENQNSYSVSAKNGETRMGQPPEKWGERLELEPEEKRERRIYRGRTVGMLRRYMRYSMETGRLPSILGREFFRSKVTSYIVVTFEKNDVRRNVIERLLNAGTAVLISAAIAMHRLWWK